MNGARDLPSLRVVHGGHASSGGTRCYVHEACEGLVRRVQGREIGGGSVGRYATALFELARDEKSVDAVKADLDKFEAMLNESVDLKRLVRSPVFSAEAQSRALAAVLESAGISGISAKFLKVLTA